MKYWAGLIMMMGAMMAFAETDDPFLWLEEVEGEKAMAWVLEQNKASTETLESTSHYQPIFKEVKAIMDSKERIPMGRMRGEWVYNFWQDENNPRGVWRRTHMDSYRSEAPEWEIVLDVDAMVEKDGIPWVFHGATFFPPEYRYCMVSLSRGGSDASEYREFDVETQQFIENGFFLPEAKSFVEWRDHDHLLVGTDFGEGSLTQSGYPRIVKVWKRGTPLSQAKTIYEGRTDDVLITPVTIHDPEGYYEMIVRVPVFYQQETFLHLGGHLVKLDIPMDANFAGVFKNRLLLTLRSDWTPEQTTYSQGSALSLDFDQFLMGSRDFDVIFKPTERTSLRSLGSTRDRLVLSTLNNVQSQLTSLVPTADGWNEESIELPGVGTVSGVLEDPDSDRFFFSFEGFLNPDSLFLVNGTQVEKLKSMPPFFKTDGLKVSQFEARAKDGTAIPYFVVTPAGFKADGTAPTLQYGYGGFENSELPRYQAVLGKAWLERGGVYVLANIRGGGEFGPRWHQAALKENRIKAFEDFIAVSEDVIKRKITSPEHLGIMGGSQGGLLVSGCMTLRPELFGAVVSQVPLTDMKRFNKLLAGASWMGEYGNPDIPEEWAFIQTWSPYHLVKKEVDYPTPFFWTTTRDDRVHPAHARKMVARMEQQGHDVYYFENTEGGHGSGSTSDQQARVVALEYAYLWKMLK